MGVSVIPRYFENQAGSLSPSLERFVADKNGYTLSNLVEKAANRFCFDGRKDSISFAPGESRDDIQTGSIQMMELGGVFEADADNDIAPKRA